MLWIARRRTRTVLCGPRMTAERARKSSLAQLLDYIMKNVDPQCYNDLPMSLLRDETENFAEFDKILREKVGQPILSLKKLRAASNVSAAPRSLVVRALMGGLPQGSIKQAQLSCGPRAVIVYDESRRTMDPKLLLLWIDGGGKGTKKTYDRRYSRTESEVISL